MIKNKRRAKNSGTKLISKGTIKSRKWQRRKINKDLCSRCGSKELYSAWYCLICWRKHRKYQENYRRSKGIIPRKQYLKQVKENK